MNPGSNTVTLEARDTSGNVASKSYSVNVTSDGASYSYDANGSLATKTEGADSWVYTWDAENRLKKVEKNSVEQASFKYDPLGRRVEKTESGVTAAFAYNGEDILRQVAASTTTYVHGPGVDEPLAAENSGILSYLHADSLGSIIGTTDGAGAPLATVRYDAWGVVEQGAPTPYGFTGREPDGTGLAYYRARYYDPKTGRFINEDPSRLWSGPNLYGYVENDPVNFTDPLGLMKVKQGVALPTGQLLINLRCLEECIGRNLEIRITETTGEHPPQNPHTLGVAADLTIGPRDPFVSSRFPMNPGGISNMDVLCCARACSFQFSQYHPPGDPLSTAPHFHVQIPPGQGGAISPTQSACCSK